MIVQTFKDFSYAVKKQYYGIKNQLYLKKITNDSKMHAAITECMVRQVITPDQFSTIFDVYDGKPLRTKPVKNEYDTHFYDSSVRVFAQQEGIKNGEIVLIDDEQEYLNEKMEELKNGQTI